MPYQLTRLKVEDYAKWKPVFDEVRTSRMVIGCKSTRLFRSADKPNEIIVIREWDNLENARRFVQSEDLRKAMERAGVADRPDVYYLDEVELLGEHSR